MLGWLCEFRGCELYFVGLFVFWLYCVVFVVGVFFKF